MGITAVDLKGAILFFNSSAARMIDRKPENLGTDIRQYHRKSETNAKIDHLLEGFESGRRSRFSYQTHRYGRLLEVVITPLTLNDQVVGVIQTVTEVVTPAEQ